MTGLEVTFKGETYRAAFDRVVDVFVTKRNDELTWNFGGIDTENMAYKWIKANLVLGDEITVRVNSIMQNSCPIQKLPFVEAVRSPLTDKEVQAMYEEKLTYFRALEAKLKEERLI
jgi:hypothetical protein